MSEPIAVTLCRATNLWPEVTAKYDVFIGELLAKFDNLEEGQFNQVPEDARNWALQAIDSLNNKNPVEECPGFDEVFDVEDHTPMFTDLPTEGDQNKVDGKPGKKSRKPRVARGAKMKADKPKKGTREARPLGDGKITKIMDAIYAQPKADVAAIVAAVKELGVDVTVPTVTSERSNYRRIVKHLATKGALSKSIEF